MKASRGTTLLGLCLFLFAAAVSAQVERYTVEDIREGERLSRIYCATCHLRPDPGDLPRAVWDQNVIPNMAAVMGLFDDFYGDEKDRILASGAVLRVPVIDMRQFKLIAAYYVSQSPAELPLAARETLPLTPLFELLERRFKPPIPFDGLVKFDRENHSLFVGGSEPRQLRRLTLGEPGSTLLDEGYVPTRVVIEPDGFYVTGMGRYVPTELQESLIRFFPRKSGVAGPPVTVLEGLPRIADLQVVDLNADGRKDLLVSMFGFYTGRFSWFEKRADGSHDEHPLLERSGAVRAMVRDLNKDGLPDIAVLVAQAIETLYFLIADGQGGFDAEVVMNQHPAWGYTRFDLADIDGDGVDDLITTNGDLDYHAPVRPYHGLRVYRGEGNYRFSEAFTRQIGGAYDFAVRDFDRDGDADIVALGYTPQSPDSERVLYFENAGGFRFEPFRLRGAEEARWLQLDAADFDRDGDDDLAFGANAAGPGTSSGANLRRFDNWKAFPVVNLVLRNQSRSTPAKRREERLADAQMLGGVTRFTRRFIR